jgi:P-type Ca2+ transporter type 2C
MSRSQTPSALPVHNAPSVTSSSRAPSPGPHLAARTAKASSITSTYSQLSPEETATRLNTSLTSGIPSSDAQARLLQHGTNELPSEEAEPLWLRFIKQFKETLILLLLGSALISFILGNFDDAVSIAIAVTIVVTVGFVQEYRSEKSLEALSKLVPHYANIVRETPLWGTRETNGDAHKSPTQSSQSPRHPAIELSTLPQASSSNGRLATTMQASQLVPGDLILFSTGDRIPADIRITKAADLTIDESNLTGENEAVVKEETALTSPKQGRHPGQRSTLAPDYASPAAGTVGADLRLTEQTNIAFMGTLVRSGYGEGIVIATGGDTEFGAISASLQEIESPRTPLQLTMDRLGQELSYISFGVIILIVLIGLIQGMELLEMFTIGVSLAVAAIPEGLPIIVTVTLALGVLRMAKQGAIVRKLPSVETLGSVNVVCSDKTGTLTLNHMTVTKMWHNDVGAPFEVSGEMISEHQDAASRTIVRIGNIANNARLARNHPTTPATAASAAILSSTQGTEPGGSRWVGQPTDVAMLDLVDAFGEGDVRERLGDRAAETPFSSGRKWMGVIMGGQNSEFAYIKGALEQVLKRCDTYLNKDGREVVLDQSRRQAALDAAEKMAGEGLRVLGFASGSVRDTKSRTSQPSSRTSTPLNTSERGLSSTPDESIYHGLVFAGLVGMNDPPRPGVEKSISRLISGGVKVIMITGDAETTALAIAKKLGMPLGNLRGGATSGSSGPVLRGDQLDKMSELELASAMAGTSIFARTSPEHKMKIIRALQSRGNVVAMTGDGVNDAPALKKADIGISMGKLGTDVAKEAADMILTDDDFSTILNAIEEGKGIFYNIQNFITFQLSTSVAALSLVLISTTLHFKNPLNAMQILWISESQNLTLLLQACANQSRHPHGRPARPILRRGAR